ncbi:tRNA (adenine(22)-N(1))-methyltransferase [Atopobacter phocae]|uniref:tRNA (adenine(22)-N(1))-methyltransferase n=1 Tax=Atopobacter phocae TaxID=136492 RepID=UPI000471489C|nr:class I SAM-dependent methyltransferase [Atopobacter phocae]
MKLSPRLQQVADLVDSNQILLDIGSDHAYLPIHLVLNQKITKAIAGEVSEGPLANAIKAVRANDLEQVISCRLGSGFNVFSDEQSEEVNQIGTVTICGMGGELIRSILADGFNKQLLNEQAVLILQPNIGEKTLRQWLMDHSYEIIDEKMIQEVNRFYPIIKAVKRQQPTTYTDLELMYGPLLLKEPNQAVINKYQEDKKHLRSILSQLNHDHPKYQMFEQKINELSEVLNHYESR